MELRNLLHFFKRRDWQESDIADYLQLRIPTGKVFLLEGKAACYMQKLITRYKLSFQVTNLTGIYSKTYVMLVEKI